MGLLGWTSHCQFAQLQLCHILYPQAESWMYFSLLTLNTLHMHSNDHFMVTWLLAIANRQYT